MAPSKRKSKKKKSNLPFLIIFLSAGALYAYWYQSGVELFPSELISSVKEASKLSSEAQEAGLTFSPSKVESDSAAQTTATETSDKISEPTPELNEEEAWDKEVLAHLNLLEPARANEIYTAYLNEKKRYSESVESSLAKSLNQFGELNTDQLEETPTELSTNEEHERRLSEILGTHYGFLQAERRKFMESFKDINPKEVEKQGDDLRE